MAAFHRRPRQIYLFGDSFMKGYSLGVFSTQLDRSHALFELSAPHRMMNLVLAENGIAWRAYYSLDLTYGDFYVSHATFRPKLEALLASGEVKSGDWLIFEDAGPNGNDPDVYQAAWENVLSVAPPAGVRRAVMTMFDYTASPASQYDTVFGARTINQALQAAGAAKEVPVIDMNAIMDSYKAAVLATDSLPVVQSDGIHMNVWGQMRFIGAILGFIGLTPVLRTYASVSAIANANYAALGYGASGWSTTKAVANCAAILG